MLKRSLDLLLATTALVLMLPLQLAVAGLVRLVLGSPVLFRQTRPGLHGRPFTLYKFRTMRLARPEAPADDAARLGAFGRLLRASSLDELPSLFNVVRGDMSLVGPRPLLMEYLPLYTPEQRRRHDARPGLTGWAQVNGRNGVPWERRFELDVWYVDHQSFALDLRILALTVWRVLRRQGVSQPGHVTMEPFRGSA